ncbi:MAG: glycosyl transferase [Deltaproteobacteria bacterium]|nr:glycosyl transferase [Deltaproteobacteria bacterium]
MKIIHYCQHVLGIGHFFRTLEICRALAGHEVTLISGGPALDIPLPDHVREVQLPGLMMDPEFKDLFPTENGKTLEEVKENRKRILFDCFEKISPDLFLVELYPFGRKAFHFELDPVLKGIRNKDLSSCRVVCSLRDILVEKKDPVAYEKRVIRILNNCFDALLVHGDPRLLKLDETFARIRKIDIPLVYTGFVARKPEPDARPKLRKKLGISGSGILVVASAGGGVVGAPLLEAVINAFADLNPDRNRYLYVFTGPFTRPDEFERLQRLSGKSVKVSRFTPDFLSYLAAADLSVSMAGYNTCMNILATQVPALVWPFPQNREQRLRAERLARHGLLEVLDAKDLRASRLAGMMEQKLSRKTASRFRADLDGAGNTAEWIERWMFGHRRL